MYSSELKYPQQFRGIKIIQARFESVTLEYIPVDRGNETSRLVAKDKNGNWLNQRYGINFVTSGSRLLWVLQDLSTENLHFKHL